VPTHALESIWRQYETFENAQATAIGGGAAAKAAAAKVLSEQRARFQAARVCYRDRKRRLDAIDFGCLAFPPGEVVVAAGAHHSHQQHQQSRQQLDRQAASWRAFVEFERGNPQRLDAPALAARVSLAYDQALMVMLHRPEWWLQAARWHAEEGVGSGGGLAATNGNGNDDPSSAAHGNPAGAVALLRRGVAALPSCLLLHFALADAEEARGRTDAAKAVYEALVAQLEPDPTAAAAAAAAASQPAPPPAGGPLLSPLPEDQAALAWCAYLRFLRRTEDLTACRRLFVRARRSARCPWRVYAEAALLEWRHGGGGGGGGGGGTGGGAAAAAAAAPAANAPPPADVARRIFEKGLEVPENAANPEYVLCYARFLLDELADASNCRALFERALATEQASVGRSRRVWAAYASLERERGADLAAALRVERRAREALGRAAADEAAGEGGGSGTATAAAAAAERARAEGDRVALALQLRRYACEGAAPLASEAQRREVERAAGPGWGFGGGGGEAGDGFEQEGAGAAAGGAPPPPQRPPPPAAPLPPAIPHSPASGGGGGGGPGAPGAVGGYPPVVGRFLASLPPPHLLDGPMPDPMAVATVLLQADFSLPPPGEGGGSGGGGGKRGSDDHHYGMMGGGGGRGPPLRRSRVE
jgi:cleavage stimulation factor subunit 3